MTKQQAENYYRLTSRLTELGFTRDEVNTLLRIERTLHRWAEAECGTGNQWCDWHIERDEQTNRCFKVVDYPNGRTSRYRVPDRETGALKRLQKLTKQGVNFYHQTDPRGCALYVVPVTEIHNDAPIDQVYSRGVAVCV